MTPEPEARVEGPITFSELVAQMVKRAIDPLISFHESEMEKMREEIKQARHSAIEEAAKVSEKYGSLYGAARMFASSIAAAIRQIKTKDNRKC